MTYALRKFSCEQNDKDINDYEILTKTIKLKLLTFYGFIFNYAVI